MLCGLHVYLEIPTHARIRPARETETFPASKALNSFLALRMELFPGVVSRHRLPHTLHGPLAGQRPAYPRSASNRDDMRPDPGLRLACRSEVWWLFGDGVCRCGSRTSCRYMDVMGDHSVEVVNGFGRDV